MKLHSLRRRHRFQFLYIDSQDYSSLSSAAVWMVWKCLLSARLNRHQSVGAQELDNKLIETGGIFDAAGVAGFGQNLVDGPWNQRCCFLTGGKRVVVFTIDHQSGNLHRSEPRCHVGSAAGAKNLRNGFSAEPRISFDKGVEKIFAQPGLGKIRVDQFSQMLAMVFFDADLGVTVNAIFDTSCASAIAAHKDQSFEHLRMIQPKQ